MKFIPDLLKFKIFLGLSETSPDVKSKGFLLADGDLSLNLLG
jgi:hypothetical protein